ncbi:MAG: hypothetical protein VYA51_05420 [Planctomycetota bacterium]|nr:hypothetical protein [Planctomycetota bacterium]
MPATPTEEPVDLDCLHCSPRRAVWRRRSAADAQDEVHKVYLSGASADAEHEVAMGVLAAGSGVVRYLGSGSDAATGRPTVRQEYVEGENLETLALRLGALPATEALRIIQRLAQTLERLHATRTPLAPHGLCHGDVKPQNLLAVPGGDVLLLDFEHARPIGVSADERAFTGGTVAWSPPEALRGASPNAAFDVFGLGATLAFLLDGGTSRSVPRHVEVDALVRACCDADADGRPAAADVATRCERLIATLADDEAEQHLHDWSAGACRVAPSPSTDPRTETWFARKRLLQRLPTLLAPPEDLPEDPAQLRAELEAVGRALRRFPRSAAALARRRDVLDAIAALLLHAAATVRDLHKCERFGEAASWLRATEELIRAATAAPGGLARIAKVPTGQMAGPLQRAPLEFVQMLANETAAANEALARRRASIEAAQRELDFASAEHHIEAMATEYGGTSAAVAEQRDALHRLAFYLDRIARAAPNVARAAPLWDAERLRALQQFVDAACAAPLQRDSGGGAVGLRSLQLTLGNVAEEFPHLTQAAPALAALSAALIQLTDNAWQQLSDAEQRLTIVPVPVRPLQLALGRLDTIRMIEAFVDRPERPRSDLLDGLERLRLGLEQARSTRDRLTENAEHALARGHWTTGLFEMERAVAGLSPGDEGERVEAERLLERLQAARRTKQELESAVRRNVELSARYVALEDDAHSTADARLRVLQERRDCLMFLGMHVQTERAELYRQDLRQVETQIALERAEDAERRLNELTDSSQRLRLARETLAALGVDESGQSDPERSGRVLRLQEHWRSIAATSQASIAAEDEQRAKQQRDRRRMVVVTLLLIVATTAAVGFAIKPWLFGQPVQAGQR